MKKYHDLVWAKSQEILEEWGAFMHPDGTRYTGRASILFCDEKRRLAVFYVKRMIDVTTGWTNQQDAYNIYVLRNKKVVWHNYVADDWGNRRYYSFETPKVVSATKIILPYKLGSGERGWEKGEMEIKLK